MKKVLSFVLVLSLVLGSFSMAFAATPADLSDVVGNANEDAIQVLFDLGVVTGNPDGTYAPAKAVNRAEFAALITRALAVPESALAGYTSTTFKDTAGYDWAVKYLAFCESKGIMLGDGQGNVMPGRTISVNEAVTMALRAVGYTSNSDVLVGTWPANYVTLAQNLNLYDDVAANLTVDKANAAQIIYNALKVQKVAVNAEGTTSYLKKADGVTVSTLLNTGLNCTTTADYILTGSDYSNSLININDLMGAFGTAYYNKDGKLIAFAVDSVALVGEVSGSYFKANGVEYTIDSANTTTGYAISNTAKVGTAFVYDNVADITATAAAVGYDDDGFVTLNVKLSGTTIKKVYSAVALKATRNQKVSTADINAITTDKKFLTETFVKNDSDAIDLNSFKLVGATSLNDIAKDNIVYVYTDGTKIREIAVGKTVVTGKVTDYKAATSIYINGTKYTPAKFAGVKQSLPNLDDTVTARLDAFGKLYSFSVDSGSAKNYAVVTAFTAENSMDNAKARMYTSADTSKVYNLVAMDDIKWTSNAATDLNTTPQVVGFDLDAAGAVKTIKTNNYTVTAGGLKGASSVAASSSAILKSTKVLEVKAATTTYYGIASDAVVYTIDKTKTPYVVDLASITDVKLNVNVATGANVYFQYILNADGDVAAMLVDKVFTSITETGTFYGVVNSYNQTMNGTTEVQKLSGFFGTTTFTDKLTDGSGDYVSPETVTGTVLKFKTDSTGTITSVDTLQPSFSYGATQSSVIATAITISAVSSDRTVLTDNATGNAQYTVAADAVVYKMTLTSTGTLDKYELSSLASINIADKVWLYDTKGEDVNGTATYVVYVAH